MRFLSLANLCSFLTPLPPINNIGWAFLPGGFDRPLCSGEQASKQEARGATPSPQPWRKKEREREREQAVGTADVSQYSRANRYTVAGGKSDT